MTGSRIFNSSCTVCREGTPGRLPYLCDSCREHLFLNGGEIYRKFSYTDRVFTAGIYGGLLKKLIRDFKFKDKRYLAKTFARLLSDCGFRHELFLIGTLVTFVPMTKRDERARGYNQCRDIAEEMKIYLPTIPVEEILIKTKQTGPQLYLTEEERKKNLQDAFILNEKIPGETKRIIIIDDIYTTGSTMESCSKAIREDFKGEIWGLVIAK